jgi:cytochrome P450
VFVLRIEQTAVIKETLRLAVPTPAGLPRVVPASGAVLSDVVIPGGVRVSCPPALGS